jgi:hypothetical protein
MVNQSRSEPNWLEAFAAWLAPHWSSDRFAHSYVIREKGRSKTTRGNVWSTENLLGAKLGYIWSGSNLEQNELEVSELRERLLGALATKKEGEVLESSLDILRWGKVSTPTRGGERASVRWLGEAHDSKSLCLKLSDSVECLKRGDTQRFDGNDLMMNSGITKVVSFADPDDKLIIYDGRVGAALGYLVRRFLEERGIPEIPCELNFGWGAAKTKGVNRNPSTVVHKFPVLWQGSEKDRTHARMMYRASELIENVRLQTIPTTTSRDWEAALFMIGYELPVTTLRGHARFGDAD